MNKNPKQVWNTFWFYSCYSSLEVAHLSPYILGKRICVNCKFLETRLCLTDLYCATEVRSHDKQHILNERAGLEYGTLWHFRSRMYKMLLTPGARDHQSETICVLSPGNAAAPCSEAEFTFTFRHVTCHQV